MENGLERFPEFAFEYGFELVQISLDSSRHFPEKFSEEKRRAISELYKDKGVGLCFHGPSDIPLLNRHESIRRAGIDRNIEMLDLAMDMGGEYYIFHPGRLAFYSSARRKIVFMEQRLPDMHVRFFQDSIKRALDHAAGRIKICFENTHAVPPQFLDVIARTAEDDGLGLVWDIGHTELLPAQDKTRIIKFFQDNIRHVRLAHLHDVSDNGDHKTLGSGRVNLTAYIDILNTIGVDTVLEIFPETELLKSLEYLRNLALEPDPD